MYLTKHLKTIKNSALCGTYDICIYGYFNTNISVGISFLGLGALSPESMKELSLNMENLSGVNLINYTGYQFYSRSNSPLQAGLIKWLIAERDEEFHVSTVLVIILQNISLKFLLQLF
jgi:hypothetical protein